MSPSPRKSPFNLNSMLQIFTLAGMIGTGVMFLAPLKTLPSDVRKVSADMNDIQKTQAVQTEALKTLAEVAKDSKDLRREFERESVKTGAAIIRHDIEIDNVRKKLERLERQ